MRPAVINGEAWWVVRVPPGDPRLIDREGRPTVGTTDPTSRTIHLSASLSPPMLDRVLLHEVSHAVTMGYGILPSLTEAVKRGEAIRAEEWAAQLVENHGMEAAAIASGVLGRPLCVRGFCVG